MDMEEWRKRIDQIDLELLRLLNERCGCALEIGRIKEHLKLPIYDGDREQRVIQNVQQASKGPLSKQALARLFKQIIDESRRAEREDRDGATN